MPSAALSTVNVYVCTPFANDTMQPDTAVATLKEMVAAAAQLPGGGPLPDGFVSTQGRPPQQPQGFAPPPWA